MTALPASATRSGVSCGNRVSALRCRDGQQDGRKVGLEPAVFRREKLPAGRLLPGLPDGRRCLYAQRAGQMAGGCRHGGSTDEAPDRRLASCRRIAIEQP
jgi:hypothetical protein